MLPEFCCRNGTTKKEKKIHRTCIDAREMHKLPCLSSQHLAQNIATEEYNTPTTAFLQHSYNQLPLHCSQLWWYGGGKHFYPLANPNCHSEILSQVFTSSVKMAPSEVELRATNEIEACVFGKL